MGMPIIPGVRFAPAVPGPGAHAAHGGALLALLFLPVILIFAVLAIDLLARGGWRPADRFVQAYAARPASIKLLCLLMLMVAALHAGLIPAHWQADPVRSVAFGGEATLLAGLAVWAITGSGWQPATAGLMILNLAGYWYYTSHGLEAVEPIGIFSKLLEMGTLGLLVAPSVDPLRAALARARLRISASS